MSNASIGKGSRVRVIDTPARHGMSGYMRPDRKGFLKVGDIIHIAYVRGISTPIGVYLLYPNDQSPKTAYIYLRDVELIDNPTQEPLPSLANAVSYVEQLREVALAENAAIVTATQEKEEEGRLDIYYGDDPESQRLMQEHDLESLMQAAANDNPLPSLPGTNEDEEKRLEAEKRRKLEDMKLKIIKDNPPFFGVYLPKEDDQVEPPKESQLVVLPDFGPSVREIMKSEDARVVNACRDGLPGYEVGGAARDALGEEKMMDRNPCKTCGKLPCVYVVDGGSYVVACSECDTLFLENNPHSLTRESAKDHWNEQNPVKVAEEAALDDFSVCPYCNMRAKPSPHPDGDVLIDCGCLHPKRLRVRVPSNLSHDVVLDFWRAVEVTERRRYAEKDKTAPTTSEPQIEAAPVIITIDEATSSDFSDKGENRRQPLPCICDPSRGREIPVVVNYVRKEGRVKESMGVVCKYCNRHGMIAMDRDKAIDLWNESVDRWDSDSQDKAVLPCECGNSPMFRETPDGHTFFHCNHCGVWSSGYATKDMLIVAWNEMRTLQTMKPKEIAANESEPKLPRCICGGHPHFEEVGSVHTVVCDSCARRSVPRPSQADAVLNWNKSIEIASNDRLNGIASVHYTTPSVLKRCKCSGAPTLCNTPHSSQFIYCPSCGNHTCAYSKKDDAVEQWNRTVKEETKNTEISPCTCGRGVPSLVRTSYSTQQIVCPVCHKQTGHKGTKEECISEWNEMVHSKVAKQQEVAKVESKNSNGIEVNVTTVREATELNPCRCGSRDKPMLYRDKNSCCIGCGCGKGTIWYSDERQAADAWNEHFGLPQPETTQENVQVESTSLPEAVQCICGVKPLVQSSPSHYGSGFFVYCSGCGTGTGIHPNGQDAALAWEKKIIALFPGMLVSPCSCGESPSKFVTHGKGKFYIECPKCDFHHIGPCDTPCQAATNWNNLVATKGEKLPQSQTTQENVQMESTTLPEITPCSCGVTPQIRSSTSNSSSGFYVRCGHCQIGTSVHPSKAAAILAWQGIGTVPKMPCSCGRSPSMFATDGKFYVECRKCNTHHIGRGDTHNQATANWNKLVAAKKEEEDTQKNVQPLRAFYMVYVDGQRGPAKRHDTEELALQEAERLLKEFKGDTKVYVLKTVTQLAYANPPISVLALA